jgi:gamma-glutamyl-gamma-aminobutyrate hydrolase PuuD
LIVHEEAAAVTKPRIGITRSGSVDRLPFTYQRYHDRIIEAGGEPVDIYAGFPTPAGELIASLDGLVLSGGPDVTPARYHAAPHPETDEGDPPRDDTEFALLEVALARDLPVLAICRGQQVLNVALGGELLQHIEGDAHRALQDGSSESRWHDVLIEPGSYLHGLLGAEQVHANSRHHQAVPADALGRGLVVTARAPDGIVEALEAPAYRWVVAVQWHPEREEVAERFRPLFAAFVTAAGAVPTATSGT